MDLYVCISFAVVCLIIGLAGTHTILTYPKSCKYKVQEKEYTENDTRRSKERNKKINR